MRCVTLSAPDQGFPFARSPVGNWYTGWYLFAFDARYAADTFFAEPQYQAVANVPTLRPGATVVRSAPLGPVTGPRVIGAPHPGLFNPGPLRVYVSVDSGPTVSGRSRLR
jgi:hypothetical protein